MNLDEFQGRKPIDLIAGTNPIIIIDEPQSVEGRQTKERMKQFCLLLRFGILQRIKLTVCIIWCIALVRQMLTRKYLVKKLK